MLNDSSSNSAPPALTRPAVGSAVTNVVPPDGVLYKVDSSRASFGELWRDCRSPLVVILWLTKLLRVRLPGSINDPNVESLAPFETSIELLPQDVRQRLDPQLQEWAGLGFDTADPLVHVIIDLFNNSRAYMASVPRIDGKAVARVVVRMEGTSVPPKTHLYCDVLSEFRDGRFLWTTGAKATSDAAPGILVQQQIGGSPAQLWLWHEKELAAMRWNTGGVPARDRASAAELLERHHEKTRDFHLSRGLFKPMSGQELRSSAALELAYGQAAGAGFAHADVLAEMQRLQNKNSSWLGGLFTLAVTLFLFISLGNPAGEDRGTRSWEAMLILVPIILFHELGHYLAMRVFGYQNVRMFFIPFFGAAVSGQNYTAPGWKKAIVTLMGPLPGIVVGAALAIVGIVLSHGLLMKIALVTLILNGFNLLPILPLDGGRMMQTLLFSRHFALDIVFRVLAGLAVLGIGLLVHDRFFAILGGIMLVGIPAAWKLGRIAEHLKRQGLGEAVHAAARPPLPGTSRPADPPIVPTIAYAIIEQVRAAFPKGMNRHSKAAAQNSLLVYEMISSRPPGWLATIGFLVLHVGGFCMAGALAMVVVVTQTSGDLRSFIRAAAAQPRQSIAVSEIDVVRGPAAPAPATAATTEPAESPYLRFGAPLHTTIVADFDKPSRARTALDAVRAKVSAGEVLERFGATVLVSLPLSDSEGRRRWITELESHTRRVGVDAGEYSTLGFSMTCVAPHESAARAIEEELNEYFELPAALAAIPPWSPDWSQLSPQQQAQFRLARQTYRRAMSVGFSTVESPESAELSRKLGRAIRYGEQDEVRRLRSEQMRLASESRQREIDALRRSNDGSIDHEVLEAYLEVYDRRPSTTGPATAPTTAPGMEDDEDADFVPPDFKSPAFQKLASRMGKVGQAGDPVYGARHGRASRTGLLITVHWISFLDPVEAAPCLVRWLDSRKCASMKYVFSGSGLRGAEEED